MTTINETNFNARLNQIGNYSYQNRMDTLFIFQLTFIFLLIGILIYYLTSLGIIGTALGGFIAVVLLVILILLYFNRISVMNKLRDGKIWSSIRFADDGKKESTIPKPQYTTVATQDGTAGNDVTCEPPQVIQGRCSSPIS